MGIDEAGRGPVLGGLFIGGVVFLEDSILLLESSEVNDSKKLSPSKREELFTFITENCSSYSIEEITNEYIDKNKQQNGSLNDLELKKMGQMIINHSPDEVYIDALGQNLVKFKKNLLDYISTEVKSTPTIITEHKADEKFKIVGAASILAKVQRDHALESYKANYLEYGDFGSGYPSDEKTIEFLRTYIKKNKRLPKIARKSWKTSINLMNELIFQKKLDGFF